jgi:hypothetical protein
MCASERAKINPETKSIGLGKRALTTSKPFKGRWPPKMKEDEWLRETARLGLNGNDPAIRVLLDDSKCTYINEYVRMLVKGQRDTKSKMLRHVVNNIWMFSEYSV